MRNSLLLVAAVAALALAGPAHSQYMYLDLNNDGVCNSSDVLGPSNTSVDVWVVSDAHGDGTPVTCNTGSQALDLNAYEFFLHATGAVTYGAWTDNLGFGFVFGDFVAGSDAYTGRGGASFLTPGAHKLGSMALSGVGTGATLSIVSASSVNPAGFTSFGTHCPGNDGDGSLKLGSDWNDVCGTATGTPVKSTTWGTIKNIYQ
jgi:hypothetical protein